MPVVGQVGAEKMAGGRLDGYTGFGPVDWKCPTLSGALTLPGTRTQYEVWRTSRPPFT